MKGVDKIAESRELIINQKSNEDLTFKTVKCTKCGKILSEGTPGSIVRGYCKRCKEFTTVKIK